MQKSALLLALLASTGACAASTEAEFKAAYAAAESANKEAGKLRNQWTTTASTLAAAKKAADAGDFDKATASAREAEALEIVDAGIIVGRLRAEPRQAACQGRGAR